MSVVYFRFYEELNRFLPEENRKVWFEFSFSGSCSIEEAFQSMEIPAADIDVILVNQQSEGLGYILNDGDRVSVYPVFESFDISGINKLRAQPLRNPKFICDVHLGRLSKYLRMLGWDTLYSNRYTPENLISISLAENRTMLSRNYELTRNRRITHSYWVESANPSEQIKKVVQKFDLSKQSAPLTRCLNCNYLLQSIEKQKIISRLQPRTASYFDEFFICPACDQIYWKGSHYDHMFEFIRHSFQKD